MTTPNQNPEANEGKHTPWFIEYGAGGVEICCESGGKETPLLYQVPEETAVEIVRAVNAYEKNQALIERQREVIRELVVATQYYHQEGAHLPNLCRCCQALIRAEEVLGDRKEPKGE